MAYIRNPFRRESNGYDDAVAPSDDGDRFQFLNRRTAVIAGILLVVVVAFGCWLAFEALQAKSSLEHARGAAQQAREALLEGNSADTEQWVDQAQSHAQEAHDATHSLPWSVALAVPWLGSPFQTGQQISDVVLGLASDVLRPSADVAAALSPDRLLEGGRVNVQLLRDSAPKLIEISAAASHLNGESKAISEPTYFSSIAGARSALQAQTSDVIAMVENTALAAQLAPSMMGADGPRTYFMGFQTNAEARGTGGLLGGFGILEFDNGTPTVDTLAANTELDKPFTPIDLGPEFNSRYGFSRATTDFRNSNQSPHFPYAAQIWKSLWFQQSGMTVDGVIAIDPVALSYILGAEGPVTMADGETVTAETVIELTESTVYARFPTDQPARKRYLQDVASAVVSKLTVGIKSPRRLLDALGKAVSEGRIAVWSSLPAEQQLLEETPLAHVVPDDPAPYAAVIVNNLGGNKMDYYLKRQIEYSADGCNGDTRQSTVTVRLENATPDHPLPDYVATSPELPPQLRGNVPHGTNAASISLIATKGSTLEGVISNGQKVPVFFSSEHGHPVFEVQVAIPPNQSGELKFLLTEPSSPGAPRVPVQPLVDNITPKVAVPECSG